MKLNMFAVLIGTSAVVLTGCETPYGTPDRTATGALTGGAIGVASGALLGGRHAVPAALVGGALGAVAGGLIGHSMDQEAQARLRQLDWGNRRGQNVRVRRGHPRQLPTLLPMAWQPGILPA